MLGVLNTTPKHSILGSVELLSILYFPTVHSPLQALLVSVLFLKMSFLISQSTAGGVRLKSREVDGFRAVSPYMLMFTFLKLT